MKYNPASRDWNEKEFKTYFVFNFYLKTSDPNAIYYGEMITLYNPNIERKEIEVIPIRKEPPKQKTSSEMDALRNLLSSDLTLMANRYQIKRVDPPEN